MRDEHQPGVLTWGVIIVVTCLVLYLFERVIWLVVPGLLALVSYYCLEPVVQALVRAGLRHQTAGKVVTGLLFLATVLGVVLFLSLAATRAAGWNAVTTHYVEGGLDFLKKTEGALAEKLPLLKRSALVRSTPTNLDAAVEQFVQKYLSWLLLQMVHWLPSLLLVPYLTYFILQDGNRFKKHLIRSVPNAFFEKTMLLFDRVDGSLRSYLVGLVKLTFLDTVCLGLGLWLLGISNPLLLGLIAAVLAWVPYAGSVAGCVLVTVVAATDFPNKPVTIYIPNGLGGFALVLWCFHCRGKEHGAEDAGAPPRPPFGHLVDGFASVALDGGDLIDWDDGKINFEAGLGPVRVGEVHRFDRDLARGADGGGDLLGEEFFLGLRFHGGHECLCL
jgi:predicted PurR-regulated permease PerM